MGDGSLELFESNNADTEVTEFKRFGITVWAGMDLLFRAMSTRDKITDNA